MVSSLSLGDCSVHRLREDSLILIRLLYSSTCFEHYYAHLQEDNCISTASGIVTVFRWPFSTQVTRGLVNFNTFITLLYMFRALLYSSSGGQLYKYSIWYRHCLKVTVQYTGYERTQSGLKSHLKRMTIPDGAVRIARHHPHHIHDLRSGSQDHHQSRNSVQKTISWNLNLVILMMGVCTRNMSS